MAKLNKAQRESIASIIESLIIAQGAQTKHLYKVGLVKDLGYWQKREAELTIKLYEEYGIELCTLSLAQENSAA